MPYIKGTITKFIAGSQPGSVECQFTDAWGNEVIIREKAPVISEIFPDEKAIYPRPAEIACQILKRWKDERGRDIVLVDIDKPYGIASIDGKTTFDILMENIIEK